VIEIVVETITIAIYGVIFYRFSSKRKLRKSMDIRDKARTDLYLAQLRSQSAPNTPGFPPTPRFAPPGDALSQAEEGYGSQFATKPQSFSQPKPFALQPPPIKVQTATPQPPQEGFEPAPVAPGEQQYDAVPIPQAYSSPISPSFPPQSAVPGQAFTASTRVESPPTSPRFPPPPKSRK
jgi:FtsZ-interacting cell division protein ZipA